MICIIRPMTQHGLAAMKTGSRGPQRQIQDRSYFLGEIRSKTSELTTEIRKIENEIFQRQEENNTFLMFEKRAESLASEIANVQVRLFHSLACNELESLRLFTGVDPKNVGLQAKLE